MPGRGVLTIAHQLDAPVRVVFTKGGGRPHGTWLGVRTGTRLARPGVEVYVDITTTPALEGSTISAVDLDLDVVAGSAAPGSTTRTSSPRTGSATATPRTSCAPASCEAVLADVVAGRGPYDGRRGPEWISRPAARPVA